MKKIEMKDLLELLNKVNVKEEGLKEVTETLLNWIMQKEREYFLQQQKDNKANGYYERSLGSLFGNLDLSVPRDRKGFFRPAILPEQWKRYDANFQDFILNLILQSYSPSKIKFLLNSLNLPYSPDQIEELKEELYLKAKELRSRELPEEAFALFIDAYHCQVKDEETKRVRKAVIYSCIGIDMEGRKSLFGYYIFYGTENKERWLKILNDLVYRGLKKVLIIISDDFPGLQHAIETLFPETDHQLCIVHLKRNIRKNMSKTDAKMFIQELSKLKFSNNYESALAEFEMICERFQKKYPGYIKMLIEKKENYLAFMKYPEPVRKHIYTTNIVENLNSRIETLRINAGGYFQSIKTAEVALYVAIDRLSKGRWRKPMPAVREVIYELRQMFNSRFLTNETQFS